jgi:hypothetical protein
MPPSDAWNVEVAGGFLKNLCSLVFEQQFQENLTPKLKITLKNS